MCFWWNQYGTEGDNYFECRKLEICFECLGIGWLDVSNRKCCFSNSVLWTFLLLPCPALLAKIKSQIPFTTSFSATNYLCCKIYMTFRVSLVGTFLLSKRFTGFIGLTYQHGRTSDQSCPPDGCYSAYSCGNFSNAWYNWRANAWIFTGMAFGTDMLLHYYHEEALIRERPVFFFLYSVVLLT